MEFQENPSRPIALSRSVVLTEKSSIPSLLLLGKLVSDGSPADSAASLPDKLRHIWGPSGTVNFWRVTDGTFLVQFNEAEDLRKALDGAPWPCGGGHDLFVMEHVKPATNMVDQIARLTKVDLWVQFHGVPVDYLCNDTMSGLAKAIGEPVYDVGHTLSVEFIRARVRVDITRPLKLSIEVMLENDEQATSVSVKYESVPCLCRSCGILGHPADRCPTASRPVTSGSSSSLSLRRESSRRHDVVFETVPAPPALISGQWPGRLSTVNASSFSFSLVARLRKWRKRSVGRNKSSCAGEDSQNELLVPRSQQDYAHATLQEPTIMPSHFIVEAHGSRSRKHARIQIVVETHCSPQLIMGAMQWLSKKGESTGMDAAYDGNKGVISIFGLQIDENTDPVDLIAHLIPKTRPKTGLPEIQTRLDSPERFTTTMQYIFDANCSKDASKE